MMSPSATTYSFPSCRITPFSFDQADIAKEAEAFAAAGFLIQFLVIMASRVPQLRALPEAA